MAVALLAPGAIGLGDWPVLALALIAQGVCDAGVTVARDRLSHGAPPSVALRRFVWVFAVDAALTPVGVLAGVAGEQEPLAVAAVLPLMGLLALFARERRARIDHALALSNAYRGTALLMSDVLEADDAYTGGEHSHGVVAMALAVGERSGWTGASAATSSSARCCTTSARSASPTRSSTSPASSTDAEFALVKRHPVDGQQMLERVGGVLGRGRASSSATATSAGTAAATPTGSPARRSRSPRASSARATPIAR